MMPSHQQLIGLLAHADPGFIAGDFATSFRSDSGPEGRTGSFRYFPGGFWEVSNGGASRHLVAPWGMRAELDAGLVKEIWRPRYDAALTAALTGFGDPSGVPGFVEAEHPAGL